MEESLAGRGDRIKAYTIAVDVFGRGADFDGMLDPVVRIEAGRLRQALAEYYAGSGQAERIRISLPKGAYEPVFEIVDDPGSIRALLYAEPPATAAAVAEQARPAARAKVSPKPEPVAYPPKTQARRAWPIGLFAVALAILAVGIFAVSRMMPASVVAQTPIAIVAHVNPLSNDEPTLALSRTLSRALPAAVARFEGLTVVAPRPDQKDQDLIASTLAREPVSRRIYVVVASTRISDGNVRTLWQLSDGRTQAILWSGTIDTPYSQNHEIIPEDEIAQKIARSIASQSGLAPSSDLRSFPNTPPLAMLAEHSPRTF
ncbi:hypothetical protein DWF00_04340 [Bosea caraganae]|uniref:Uncharacterized protein n=1 Tax=Bosea caraganae TaxID=2763117 RepID=A0A370KXX4_9HYPH|nr:hypothetical protein [Bosea caraganae]RDJ19818.1 hypothetical protein DWE98_27785 [Bosea caraganae]RDJ30042.1 hypothetical protein DWF00_04340 [Bosea caraganae]